MHLPVSHVPLPKLTLNCITPQANIMVADSIPEMAMGWGSTLMQNEATFMSLDGAMLIIACGLLTILHPAIFFPYMGKTHKNESERVEDMEMDSREQLRRPEESKNASPSVST